MFCCQCKNKEIFENEKIIFVNIALTWYARTPAAGLNCILVTNPLEVPTSFIVLSLDHTDIIQYSLRE